MSMHLRGSRDMMGGQDESWWRSRTGLEQKLIILSSLLFIVSFALVITVIVLKNSSSAECHCNCTDGNVNGYSTGSGGTTTTLAPTTPSGNETTVSPPITPQPTGETTEPSKETEPTKATEPTKETEPTKSTEPAKSTESPTESELPKETTPEAKETVAPTAKSEEPPKQKDTDDATLNLSPLRDVEKMPPKLIRTMLGENFKLNAWAGA